MNGKYVCPPDASPAWRAAMADGFDMSLIELSLAKPPWQRLSGHDRAPAFALEISKEGGNSMAKLSAMVERLLLGRIDFVLIGGYAAVAHGVSFVTWDLDICCCFSEENLCQLGNVLREIHTKHRMTPAKLPLENLNLETDLGKMDCFRRVSGVGDYDEVRKCAIEIECPAGPCPALDIDTLIRTNEEMNRPYDRFTVTQLKAIRERLWLDGMIRSAAQGDQNETLVKCGPEC